MVRRILGLVLIAIVGLATLGGCTGSREKGKNQDYDRPRTPDTRR